MIYTNIDMKKLKKPRWPVKQVSDAVMIASIKGSQILYVDTETYAHGFVRDEIIDEYVETEVANGKKITASTRTRAEKHAEELRGEMALDPKRSRVRLLQVSDGKDVYVFDAFVSPLDKAVKAISNKDLCGQNLKFDLKVLMTQWKDFTVRSLFDTMIAHKIHRTGEIVGYFNSHLQDVVKYWTNVDLEKGHGADDWSKPITIEQFEYSVLDVLHLKNVSDRQIKRLNEDSVCSNSTGYFNGTLFDMVSTIEMKFVEVLVKAELTGILINEKFFIQRIEELDKEIASLEKDFVKDGVNVNSPKQVIELLESVGIDVISSDEQTLIRYVARYPIVSKIMKLKKAKKERNAIDDYLNVWRDKKTGRIYANFNQIRYASGRMSCYEPNVQQIKRSLKKNFYLSTKTRRVFKADYPSIEARIMGVISKDREIIDIFREKRDMHNATASDFLHKDEKSITKDERLQSKAANFGFMYGMGALKFIEYAYNNYGLEISLSDAETLKKKYLNKYAGVRRLHQHNASILSQNTEFVSKTIIGRRMRCDKFTNANNYPVQGTGADMLKLASVMFYNRCKTDSLDAAIVNLVHDELVVESSLKDYSKAKKHLSESMSKAADFMIELFHTEVEIEEVKP